MSVVWRLVALVFSLSGCTHPRGFGEPAPRVSPPSPVSTPSSRAAAIGEAAVGRWLAVDILSDPASTRDLPRGALEKVLIC